MRIRLRMKKKIVIISVMIGIMIGIIILVNIISLNSVRVIGDTRSGLILKDANENVTATIFATLYNGTNDNKNIIFEVDGGYEYSKGYLKGERYAVANIEIRGGNAQVDMETMVLTIPSHEEINLTITAYNVYVGEDYQGEEWGLRKEAPEWSFVVIE